MVTMIALPAFAATITALLLGVWLACGRKPRKREKSQRVHVLVLGDVGHSPRMMNHALSLARNGFKVNVIGYGESDAHEAFRRAKLISEHHLRKPPVVPGPFILRALVKITVQVTSVVYLLWSLPRAEAVLVQNPPAIPTLLAALFVCRLRHTKLVIDWHNYGYSILALTKPRNGFFVRMALIYERFFGRCGDAHFCVTRAMKDDLKRNWGIAASVLYDKPPSRFRRLAVDETHEFLLQLQGQLPPDVLAPFPKPAPSLGDEAGGGGVGKGDAATLLTTRLGGGREAARMRQVRPVVIVSGTSWTPDEDFGVLLDALVEYDRVARAQHAAVEADTTSGDTKANAVGLLPDVLCIITGKGPLKEFYMAKVACLELTRVRIRAVWLRAADYPLLLGVADLGVCLHKSSSGLDLPMKVVDMFGCSLPVCAIRFACLGELVVHEGNGLVFDDAPELANALVQLFRDPRRKLLGQLRNGAAQFRERTWDAEWNERALPVFVSSRTSRMRLARQVQ